VTVSARGIRWLGISVGDASEAGRFLGETLGMRVRFETPDTIELETTDGDRVQLFAPAHPYHQKAQRPLPLFEVEDASAARAEIAAAGVEVGPLDSDSAWDWFDVFGPEGLVFELGSRR
jgi:catechol 2,3-dioxygenase-like lactoylglutathione lyase family enzyme